MCDQRSDFVVASSTSCNFAITPASVLSLLAVSLGAYSSVSVPLSPLFTAVTADSALVLASLVPLAAAPPTIATTTAAVMTSVCTSPVTTVTSASTTTAASTTTSDQPQLATRMKVSKKKKKTISYEETVRAATKASAKPTFAPGPAPAATPGPTPVPVPTTGTEPTPTEEPSTIEMDAEPIPTTDSSAESGEDDGFTLVDGRKRRSGKRRSRDTKKPSISKPEPPCAPYEG